ncbi:serine/threonine protein kinase [Paeniglutamicibacter cryotolerans]|uniref:non-specific serine/threonine protein kinase n=1 Tax=Paeniglutamicibacter cryotolerans TaxID=670079 RepID=A0A839QXF8_9MICC|nr:serine/threonine-protein kinase [Paeniglutamicibacter cryotolerans]MBB2996661.1 hypothetical protein [Paeniglutamicibacter cryotolerans]
MDSSDALMPTPVVSGYVTERRLGSGASSSVYVLRRQGDGTLLALKLLDPLDPGSVADEARLGVEHEFLLANYGLVDTDRGQGLLLKYCPGGSAARLLAVRGPLGTGEAVTVCAPIAAALAYLHSEGVVHGDVSPGNILFTAEGMPQLADLGLRAVLGRGAPSGGTPGFMAPETGGGQPGLLHPARDVYGLGAVLWYLLTGRTAGATRQRPPLSTLMPGIPEELVELIESCLQEDPALRPTAEDVAQRIFTGTTARPIELEDVVGPEDSGLMATVVSGEREARRLRWPTARPRPRRVRRGRTPRTPWVPGVALGVLALLIVAGAGLWLSSGPRMDAAAPMASVPAPSTAARLGPRATASPSLRPSTLPSPVPSTAPRRSADNAEAPARALVRLAALRDEALASGSAVELDRVHASGSPALAHDRRTVEALKARGVRFVDLETVLSDVRTAESPGGGVMMLTARSVQASYRVEDGRGQVLATSDGRGDRVRFELRLSEQGWKIWSVTAAD